VTRFTALSICICTKRQQAGGTYLIFGDIEGKLDLLRVECTQVRPQGPLQRSQAHREIRPQRQYDEMEGTAQRRLFAPRRAEFILSRRSSVRIWVSVANAASMSRMVLAFRMLISRAVVHGHSSKVTAALDVADGLATS